MNPFDFYQLSSLNRQATTPYLLMAASALILAIGGTPVMRMVALRFGVIDAPNARKIHASPVPRMGGAAIYIAFLLVLSGGAILGALAILSIPRDILPVNRSPAVQVFTFYNGMPAALVEKSGCP